MKFWALLFLATLFSQKTFAESDRFADCALSKAMDTFNNQKEELSWFGSVVEWLYLGDSIHGKVSDQEEIFLKNHPMKAMQIKAKACRAAAVSYTLCGFDPSEGDFSRTQDEEADAIRHFLFSTYLTCNLGSEMARNYTLAHEGTPPWSEASKMDIYNNEVGYEWATDRENLCGGFAPEFEIAKASLQMLSEGKLMTLRAGSTNCRVPDAVLADLAYETPYSFWQTVNYVQSLLKGKIKLCD